jgi:hypothetical protein
LYSLDIEAPKPTWTMDDLRVQRERQDILLKRIFAGFGLVVMLLELGVATVIFWHYGEARRWLLPDAVISAYLGATVVQVVSLVLVMTRSLFPHNGGDG